LAPRVLERTATVLRKITADHASILLAEQHVPFAISLAQRR
jgi:ABC-type branched-subunit amino acid transport system ATPase component